MAAGHPKVSPYHLLAAILDDSGTREAIEHAGGSLAQLMAFASSGLQQVDRPSVWERLVAALERPPIVESSAFRSVLHAAWVQVRRASQREVGPIDVLVAFFRDSSLGAGMKQSGLTRLALLRYHCHGLAASADSKPPAPAWAQCKVVVFNDHYTEMETVVRILEKAFDMKPTQAFKTMLQVHHDGQMVLGPFSTDEAVRRMVVAIGMAEAEEAPLRLQLQPSQG
jgi:ATP-dependent Clp protease adapter protein ClpS